MKVQDHNHSYSKYNPQATNGQFGGTNPGVPDGNDMKNRDKITISTGDGEPIDILPSSIQGLVAHLVVDASIVYDTCQFTIPSGTDTSGTPFTVSSPGSGTALFFTLYGGPKESKVNEDLPFCLNGTLTAPVSFGTAIFKYPNDTGEFNELSIDNICAVNGPLDFVAKNIVGQIYYAGKLTLFPLVSDFF